jgi:hypothetical protein
MKKSDPALDRSERVLVLLLLQSMKDDSQAEKVRQLNIAGLSNIQIAEFLQTTPAVVAQLLYVSKKSGKAKNPR